MFLTAEAAVSLADGRPLNALEGARRAVEAALSGGLGVAHEAVRLAFPTALDAAMNLGDLEEAHRLTELLATRPRGEVPPFLRAQVTRARALIAAARGQSDDVEEELVAAEGAFRELGYPYWTARAQLDRAEWLVPQDRAQEAARLAHEAAETFEVVGAAPMLARALAVLETGAAQLVGGVESRRGSSEPSTVWSA